MSGDSKPLLIELGTEELPPKALEKLSTAFADGVVRRLESARLDPEGAVERFCSPRRLAVRIEAVRARQREEAFQRLGPKVEAAWNADGTPTRAAEGFARSAGVAVAALETAQTDKGERLVARGVQEGAPLATVLAECIEGSLHDLPIPRRMRWGAGEQTFVRPVHWLLVRHGTEVPEIEVMGLRAEGRSRGHRFHHGGALEVPDACSYEAYLRSPGYVLVDPEERRARIETQVRAEAVALGGVPVLEPELLDEVNALVEWPVAIGGSFDEAFLAVAEEALISSMQGHQRCFPVRGREDGALHARFIAVANLESRRPEAVRQGNERVIRPRLADAQFFWEQDRKRSLAERLEQLESVLFHRRLGSLRQRVARMGRIAEAWCRETGAGDPEAARRGAELAKCDLLTEMVGEFPELQGVMGGYYARNDGESDTVADAIASHYQPAFAGDAIPATPEGQAVSIADRADTLLGIFCADGAPSGDKDPFALRRAALGLIRVVLESGRDGDLRDVLERAAEGLEADGVKVGSAVDDVIGFCRERLTGYYAEQGIGREVLQALESYPVDRLRDFDRRVHACQAFLGRPEAQALAGAQKRISNLLRKAEESGDAPQGGSTESPLDGEGPERALGEAVEECRQEIMPLIAEGQYEEALSRLSALREPVDAFFEGVMVLADAPQVRQRRLALLQAVREVFLQVADVSRLPAER